MDIEQSSVQALQSGMEELHKRKEKANQTTAASLPRPCQPDGSFTQNGPSYGSG
jgi:hypothetical protein